MSPIFFSDPSELRKWFEKYHETETELLIGYHKVKTGTPGLTWSQSVDEAICFGWIDGIRRSIDDKSYTIRFTPRKPKSIWSAVNIRKVEELTRKGLMEPAGIIAFEKREDKRSKIYSFEQKNIILDKSYLKSFRENKKAWSYFQSRAPSYQRTAIWWVMSARQEETRLRRINTLIHDSENGLHIKSLRR